MVEIVAGGFRQEDYKVALNAKGSQEGFPERSSVNRSITLSLVKGFYCCHSCLFLDCTFFIAA